MGMRAAAQYRWIHIGNCKRRERSYVAQRSIGRKASLNMTSIAPVSPARRVISNLRWWIAAVLFASTIINYLDRQTLSLLAPYLKVQYHWTNTDYAYIVIAFRVAYAIGQTVFG